MSKDLISRRGMVSGIAGFLASGLAGGFSFTGTDIALSQKPAEPRRSNEQDLKYSFSFSVYVFGKEWLDNKGPYSSRGLKISSPCSFTTFDFYPKELVLIDLYNNDKPVARNLNEKNLSQLVLPRIKGKANFRILVRDPEGGKTYNGEIDFLNNREIFEKVVGIGPQKSLIHLRTSAPGDYEEGVLLRSFCLPIQNQAFNVDYHVFGIECLIDSNRDEMLRFWKNRERFKGLEDFRKYAKEYDSAQLILEK